MNCFNKIYNEKSKQLHETAIKRRETIKSFENFENEVNRKKEELKVYFETVISLFCNNKF